MYQDTMNRLIKAINDLKAAKEYLESVRKEFESDPDLLNFYEPSAKEIVKQFEDRLYNLISEITGTNFEIKESSQDVEVWIRIEGDRFRHGSGPIHAIASFLQKLNTASQQVINLFDKDVKRKKKRNVSLFDLAETASGSLRLGLKTPDIDDVLMENTQPELFPQDPWDLLKKIQKEKEKALKGLRLLVKALDSVENETIEDIKQELPNDIAVVKLLHYAKEIAPSQQSLIEKITFEGKDLHLGPKKRVTVDKQTRKLISERAKEIKRDAEYVKATGVIRQQDLDNYVITARPLFVGNKDYPEVKCVFNPNSPIEEMENYLDKIVTIRGFLFFREDNVPQKLEIDEIVIERDREDD